MKAFEKWWVLEWQNLQGGRREPVGEELAEISWRAALEWVLVEASAWRKCGIKTELEYYVEQELEN